MNNTHLTFLFFGFVFLFLYFVPFMPRGKQIALVYLRYLVLASIAALILAPFFWLICSAFKDPEVLMAYTFLPPVAEWSSQTINFSNLKKLFEKEETLEGAIYFWQYVVNSFFLASTSTVVTLFFSSLGGYALAKYEFRGRSFLILFMLGTMMIPAMLLLSPLYHLIHKINWMDTYWALIVPGACSAFGMFLFRQAFFSVPSTLVEAARIDGCGEFGIYLNIVMPLVRPITAAFCLISFLGSWNAFIAPDVFIQTQSKLTLTVALNQYVDLYDQQYGVFLAGTLLAIIPPAILFFSLEKEFVSGLTSGAIKG